MRFSADPGTASEFSLPSLSSALKDIGLKLEKGKDKFDVIVIDQIERVPTEN
jgi:uncharacterized protein (TIGR03435 family)